MLKKDEKGLLYSTELLLGIILLLIVVGIIANLTDELNDKILDKEDLSAIEKISVEVCDYLINNPGTPEDWESDEGLGNNHVNNKIIAGLALKDKKSDNGQFKDESDNSEHVLSHVISYYKLKKIQTYYDELINKNLFNNSLKSSISIYPINSYVESIECGDNLDSLKENVIVVNRSIKCDYLSNYVIYNFNDFELQGRNYIKDRMCNHDTQKELESHDNDNSYFYLCKSFRIYKKSLENYSYYLISSEKIKNANCYWSLETLNNTTDNMNRFDKEIISLDERFLNDFEYKYNDIYLIHFKVPKDKINDFKTVLVAIPKDLKNDIINNNQLKYDYYRIQDVNFVLKTAYS